MEMEKKHRNILLIASGLVLLAALALWGGLTGKNPNEPLAAMLRGRGYTVDAEQFYHAGSFQGQSISQVLAGMDLEEAVAASRAGGFPSDVERPGAVELLLCGMGNGDVITLFLLDGQVELCFVQSVTAGTVAALDGAVAP